MTIFRDRNQAGVDQPQRKGGQDSITPPRSDTVQAQNIAQVKLSAPANDTAAPARPDMSNVIELNISRPVTLSDLAFIWPADSHWES